MAKTKTKAAPMPTVSDAHANFEVVSLDSLHLDGANVRVHPEDNRSALESSLAQFGPARSIVLDGNDVVRAGNGTVEAAHRAGITEVLIVDPKPGQMVAVRRKDWSPTQATAYGIADNKISEMAVWDEPGLAAQLRSLQSEDFDLAAVGYDAGAVDALIEGLAAQAAGGLGDDAEAAEDPGAEPDRAEELLAKWKCKAGDLWVIPSLTTPGREHRLICDDSTNPEVVSRLMGGDKADIICTDPPYGVDFKRGQFITDSSRVAATKVPDSIQGDSRKGADQADFIQCIFETARPHCREAASVYMFSAPLVEGCHSMLGLGKSGVHVQSQLVWVKNNHCLGIADYHWKHEICWYGWFEGAAHRWFGDRDKFTVLEFARLQSTIHPNEKPVGIIAHFLENSSLRGEIVYEPFSGSGTSLVAAEQNGRVCYANELEPKYAALSLERLSGLGLHPRLSA